MARPKEFDPDRALERALELFHRCGYEATSMQDLVEHMGIGRGSLYETFGNKQALFRAALERYCERMLAAWSARLERSEQPVRELREMIVETASRTGGPGCMVGNTCVELAGRDDHVSAMCATTLARLERVFVQALERGIATGELPADANPRAIARLLVTVLQGVAVIGKAPAGRPMIKDAVRLALGTLD